MKPSKAYAKVNIFLKITGTRGIYHEIISRFMKVPDLYDELSFVKKADNAFQIIGDFNCSVEQNTIYKAYKALLEHTKSIRLENFFKEYGVHVKKNIPSFAGLGGGSSDAATFLQMCNVALNLHLTDDELAHIGVQVGADVPFFVYGFASANVSGIGEIVEAFDEKALPLSIYTPAIEIATPKVYQTYKEHYFAPISAQESKNLASMRSVDILKKFTIDEANDLFKPALYNYPQLKTYQKEGYFFSGSGSSFFQLKAKYE